MVKGISRQVIVVHAPEPKLFEQAIFILRDGQKEVTDEALLKEAEQIMHKRNTPHKGATVGYGILSACCGAILTGIAWLITVLI